MCRLIRLGLLVCDTFPESIEDKYGDYEGLFRQMFIQNAQVHGHVSFTFQAFNVGQGHYPSNISDFDAFLITGSSKSLIIH